MSTLERRQRLYNPVRSFWLPFSLCVALLPQVGRAKPASDYVHAPTLTRLLHWERFPLRVFIATHDTTEAAAAHEALAGFDAWGAATNGVVRYVVVNSPTDADVSVRFVPESTMPGQPGVVGVTSVVWTRTTLKKATMTLATGAETPEQVQSVASHEFGHVLGIEGHSDDSDDMMFPSQTRYYENGMAVPAPARRITGRDLNTLKACYPQLFGLP